MANIQTWRPQTNLKRSKNLLKSYAIFYVYVLKDIFLGEGEKVWDIHQISKTAQDKGVRKSFKKW